MRLKEAIVGVDQGYPDGQRVIFKRARTADYRASIHDIAEFLLKLMKDAELRRKMGEAGRERVVKNYDYRVVARKLIQILNDRLGIS